MKKRDYVFFWHVVVTFTSSSAVDVSAPYQICGLVAMMKPTSFSGSFTRYCRPLAARVAHHILGRLVGLVVKASFSRTEDPGSGSHSTLQWLPSQAPGVIGLALGLVGPVSVFCDWMR